MRNQYICLVLAIVLVRPCASAQWVKTNGPYGAAVKALAVSGTNLYAGTGGFFMVEGVYRSTDSGTSWTKVTNATQLWITALAVYPNEAGDTIIFAGTHGGVFRSTNNGTSWTEVNSGLPSGPWVTSFAYHGKNLFTGLYYGGVYLSTDDGTSWTVSGLADKNVLALAVTSDGKSIIAGVEDSVAYLSSDNGTSWTPTGVTGDNVRCFAVSGRYLFAAVATRGIFRSADNGISWTQVKSDPYIYAFAGSPNGTGGTNIFAGSLGDSQEGGSVLLSTDSGTSWTAVNTGLTNIHVACLAVSGTMLFAGIDSVVWRRPLSEMMTNVHLPEGEVPTEFGMRQNYPNPFNPTTSIRYGLPHKSQVSLMVYNTLGQLVSELVQGEQEPGYHEVKFDASNLASGMYFYRLTAGDFVQSKKCLLLK